MPTKVIAYKIIAELQRKFGKKDDEVHPINLPRRDYINAREKVKISGRRADPPFLGTKRVFF